MNFADPFGSWNQLAFLTVNSEYPFGSWNQLDFSLQDWLSRIFGRWMIELLSLLLTQPLVKNFTL